MASRRQGAQLVQSIFLAVRAQVAADGSRLSSTSGSQLTSLYSELLQPQQLTCLRGFSGSSPAFSPDTTATAEVRTLVVVETGGMSHAETMHTRLLA